MQPISPASYWPINDEEIIHTSMSKRKRQQEAEQHQESRCVRQESNKRQKTAEETTTASNTVMNKKDMKWFAMLQQLESYRRQHGNCVVPRGYAPNKPLASWVAEQRKQYKLMKDGRPSNITPQRVSLLNNIGFIWSAQESAWNRQFDELIKYKATHGDCLVPVNYSESPHLGAWVKEQRRHYALKTKKQGKKSHMTEERIKALESVGFCWDSHEASWWEKFRELEAHHKVHGHSNVPTKCRKNPQLGTWVHHQRRQYKASGGQPSSRLTMERMEALDRLGFCWCPRGGGGLRRAAAAEHTGWEDQSHDDEESSSSSLLSSSSSSPSSSSCPSSSSSSCDNDDTFSITSNDESDDDDDSWNEWDEEFNEAHKTYFMQMSNENVTSLEIPQTPSNFEDLLDEKVQKLEALLFGLTKV